VVELDDPPAPVTASAVAQPDPLVPRGLGTPPLGVAPCVDDLQFAIAARDEFLAVLGHELRNAVAPLVLLAEQFELSEAVSSQARARADLLTKHLRRLANTIERIAEIPALRDGTLELDRTQVDLGELATHVGDRMRREALAGGVEIRIEAAPGVIGYWDRMRVKQLLVALLGNAIRYSGAGVVDVIVRSVDHAELIVRDYGPGIPEAQRAHLFDRFDHLMPRQAHGLGVGLWVVKTLCHAMGGNVHLAAGPGATFCVTLPREPQP
jgi:signal transduction histidine kinase